MKNNRIKRARVSIIEYQRLELNSLMHFKQLHHLHVLMHLCDKAFFFILLQFKDEKQEEKVNRTTNERNSISNTE